MIEQVRKTLIQQCHIDPALPLLVGVSGGPDSLFMLDVLNRLGYRLILGHLDHNLRPESPAEAVSVREFAEKSGIPAIIESRDVITYARQHQVSTETAARQLRYEFLFHQAEIHQAQAVAVGHHADDQVETVLLHLLRGTGLYGLTGMPYRSIPNAWSDSIPLIRPLLNTWRSEILLYLEERHITPHWDATNLDTAYLRNRIRHDLIPHLEKYNPQIRQGLWRTAEILQQEDQEIQSITQKAWQDCLYRQGEGYLVFDQDKLSGVPTAIQRRLIRKAMNWLHPGLQDIEFGHIEKIIQFLRHPPRSASSDIALSMRVILENRQLWITLPVSDLPIDTVPQVPHKEQFSIQVPGETRIAGGWQARADILPSTPENLALGYINPDPWQAWLDFDKVARPLSVRCRQPGDRFQPLGMKTGSIKLSDIFINQKIPARARPQWPVVVDAREIVWLPGFRVSEKHRLAPDCKKILHLQILKSDH